VIDVLTLVGLAGVAAVVHHMRTTRTCPSCAETVKKQARVCKHCGEKLLPGTVKAASSVASGPEIEPHPELETEDMPQPLNDGWWWGGVQFADHDEAVAYRKKRLAPPPRQGPRR
jgi:hypothetical protein